MIIICVGLGMTSSGGTSLSTVESQKSSRMIPLQFLRTTQTQVFESGAADHSAAGSTTRVNMEGKQEGMHEQVRRPFLLHLVLADRRFRLAAEDEVDRPVRI